MMPMVSIIVPIYKVEAYLPECIDSVLDQTFTDFELILVDDGSPDGSGRICDAYAEKDGRIRVIHKVNGGLSDARNAGLDVAVGNYIYFLDGDDSIAPNLLETVVSYMENGHDLAVFTFRSFYDDGTFLPPWPRKKGSYQMNTPEERRDFVHKVLMQTQMGWEAWSRIFVRKIIEKYHLRFADNRKIFAEDMYFSLCYCAHISKIVCIDDCLYNYRQRRDSIMGQQTGRNNVVRIEQLAQEVLKHYQQWDDCKLLADHFAFLHFQIMMNQFIFQLQYVSDPEQYRSDVISSLINWSEIQGIIRRNMTNRSEMKKYYSPLQYFEVVQNAEFLLGGSLRKLRVSNRLIQKIKNQKERLKLIMSSVRR